jgi:hypothetical protein
VNNYCLREGENIASGTAENLLMKHFGMILRK